MKSFNKFAKFCMIFSGIILSIFLVLIIIMLFSRNKFFFNTTLNNIDVSFNNTQEVVEKIKNYTFEEFVIEENDNVLLTLNTNDFVNFVVDEEKIDSLIKSYFLVSDDINYKFDKNINIDVLKSLVVQINNDRTDSKDAFVYLDENMEYNIVPEFVGNKIDIDLLISTICFNIQNDNFRINLNDFYIAPTVFKDNVHLLEEKNRLNKQFETVINYELFDSNNLLLDKIIYKNWLYIENDNILIDEEKVNLFVEELAKNINTTQSARLFKTSNNIQIEVKPGTYGFELDKEKEKDFLINNILSGESVSRRPIFKQEGLVYSKNDIGDTYVEVDIDNQHMYFYKEGSLLLESDIVSGTANQRYHTLTGVYYIFDVNGERYLIGPTWRTFVNCFMPFTFDGQGFHDATWRSSFGGNIYEYSGSHGCVNMPKDKALLLYKNVYIGIPVIVYSEKYGYLDL